MKTSNSYLKSEDELHYVMVPDIVHGTDSVNSKPETFHPHLGNEDVVDLVNLETALD